MSKSNDKKKILIVDDAAFTRNMLKKIINKTDYSEVIGEAANGNEAIDQYKKLKPEAITNTDRITQWLNACGYSLI